MRTKPNTSTMVSVIAAVLLDALAVGLGFATAFWIRFYSGWIDAPLGIPETVDIWRFILVGIAVLVLVFRLQGLYVRPHRSRFEDQIPRLIKSLGINFLCFAAVDAIVRLDPPMSRIAFAITIGTISFFVILFRYLCYRVEWNCARHLPRVNRVLLVGTDGLAHRIRESIRRDPFMRAEVLGFIATRDEERPPEISPDQVLGNMGNLTQVIRDGQVNELILCDSRLDHEGKINLAITCEKNVVRFAMVPDLFRLMTSGVDMQTLAGVPVIGLNRWPLDRVTNRILKRGSDVVGALVGLVLGAPMLLLAAVAIRLTSPGPIFYRQERCGENGKRFNIYKLRTMRVDADPEDAGEAGRPGWTRPGDARVTPIGRFLRRTNLDEWPQFWNVLLGQMSMVGPRPERPFFVEQFKEEIDRYMARHMSRPGMTGWAQVNGLRGDTSITERIRYDLYYLENWSLSFDFKIIIKTLTGRQRNAY